MYLTKLQKVVSRKMQHLSPTQLQLKATVLPTNQNGIALIKFVSLVLRTFHITAKRNKIVLNVPKVLHGVMSIKAV
jgi:hypothetical protein